MADIQISTRLEIDGKTIIDEAIAEFLRNLAKGMATVEALASSSTTHSKIQKWRIQAKGLLGDDPLVTQRGRLTLSETGRELLKEYHAKASRLRVQLASGAKVPLLAVDGLVLYGSKLVTIKRKYYPFEGAYCLPGGMVEYGETVEGAVLREVEEETGLRTSVESLVGVYSDPDRDPRGHVISLAFVLKVEGGELISGSDAAEVALFNLDDLPELGFDHATIVDDFLRTRRR